MEDIKQTLEKYVSHKIEPGGFLKSVLENNLFRVMGSADHINKYRLWDICNYIYNNLPSNCWGSPEIVNNWLNNK